MPSGSSLDFGEALARWVVFVITFIIAGGVAAGAASWVYEWVTQQPQTLEMYVLIFAASGFFAYRLIREGME
jgi:hypothetical protein